MYYEITETALEIQQNDHDWKEFAIGFWRGFAYTFPIVLVLVGIYLGLKNGIF